MLILTKKELEQALSMQEAIEIDKQALANYSAGKTAVPLRTNLALPETDNTSLCMPAYVGGAEPALGVKIISVYPENIQKGLPSVPATMVVLDPATGIVSAILEGTYLTQLRTGAVQGAATDLLARQDAKIAALIGTGGQAATQLLAMDTVRALNEIRVYDQDLTRAAEFVTQQQPQIRAKLVTAPTSQACVEGADIITSVTTAKQATFSAEWVKPGAHLNGVGAFTPEMVELPAEIIQRAETIFFDTYEGVWAEAGDFIQPLQKGLIKKSDITGELGELVLGKVAGRKNKDAITIFKTVGSAVLDVAVAQAITKQALTKGLGQNITL